MPPRGGRYLTVLLLLFAAAEPSTAVSAPLVTDSVHVDPDSAFPAFLKQYLEAYRRSRKEASRWIHPKLPYRTVDNPGAHCVLRPPSRTVGIDPVAGGSEVVPPDTRIVIRRGIPAVKDPCDDAGPYRGREGFYWDPVPASALPRFGRWKDNGDLETVVPWIPVPRPWRVMRVVYIAEGWDQVRMHFVWVDGGWHPWVDDHCTPCSA